MQTNNEVNIKYIFNYSHKSFLEKTNNFNKSINNIFYFNNYKFENNNIILYFNKNIKFRDTNILSDINIKNCFKIFYQILKGYKFYYNLGHLWINLNLNKLVLENKIFKMKLDLSIFKKKFKIIKNSEICYLSPESLNMINNLNSIDSHKTDIWSIGIIFYKIIHKELPFEFNIDKLKEIDINIKDNRLYLIKKANYVLNQIKYKMIIKTTNNADIDNLLSNMLKFNVKSRISFNKLIQINILKPYSLCNDSYKVLNFKYKFLTNYECLKNLNNNYLKYILYNRHLQYIFIIKKYYFNNKNIRGNTKNYWDLILIQINFIKSKLKNILNKLILYSNNDYSNWELNNYNYLYELKKQLLTNNNINIIRFYINLEEKNYIRIFNRSLEKDTYINYKKLFN